MSDEIERKFAVAAPPDGLDHAPSAAIEQGYIDLKTEGAELRIRRKGERTLLTVKHGSGHVRREHEVEIDEDAFAALWPLTEGRRISKRRFELAHGDHTIEVDRYEGALEGLIVAEVEFESEEASDAFQPPEWLGEELTGNPDYSNRALAELSRAPA